MTTHDTSQNTVRPIITSFLVLFGFVLVAWFDGDLLENFGVQALSQTRKILFYSLQCAIWLSGAYFFNTLVNYIFWDRIFARILSDAKVPRLLKNVTGIIIFFIAVTGIVGMVFNKPITGIWATSGVIGIVVGLALQSMIRDIFVGLAVNIDKPYAIGDFITVHPHTLLKGAGMRGIVQEINWRTTKILTPDKNVVYVPNSVIGASVLTNHSQPDRMTQIEITLNLPFNTDPQRASRVLMAATLAVAKDKGPVLTKPAPQIRIANTSPDGIEFRVRFPANGAPGPAKNALLTSILQHMHQAGMSLLSQQYDVFVANMPQRSLEGTTVQDRLGLLRRMEMFAPLTEEELQFIAESALPGQLKLNDVLFTAGTESADHDYSMYVLVEGLLHVSMDIGHNNEMVRVGQVEPGQFFGEMSLLTGVPRSATITAATDALVYEITQKSMAELLQKRPVLMNRLSEVMAERRLRNENTHQQQSRQEQEAAKASLANQLFSSMKNMFGRIWSQPH